MYVLLTTIVMQYISYMLHKIRSVTLFLLWIPCFLLKYKYVPTEWKFLNLLWSDIDQNIEVCLTVCNTLATICFVTPRDLLSNQEE